MVWELFSPEKNKEKNGDFDSNRRTISAAINYKSEKCFSRKSAIFSQEQ
jgi:hypothetical protein